jgi:uncharacterized protein (DUF302 family)
MLTSLLISDQSLYKTQTYCHTTSVEKEIVKLKNEKKAIGAKILGEVTNAKNINAELPKILMPTHF